MGAVPPIMVKTEANPGGLPMEVFDGFRKAYLLDRSQFFLDVASGPFFNFNRPGVKVSQGLIQSWWMQGMMSGFKNAYDCIKAFSETDFTEDLEKFDVPTLIIHGDEDQIVPIGASALLSARRVPNAILKIYPAAPTAWATRARTSSIPTCSPSSDPDSTGKTTLLDLFTLVHILISLAGLVSGLVVAGGWLAAKSYGGWTALFLVATVATSVTGFFFPFRGFTPAFAVGILSLIVLAVAIYALYVRKLAGVCGRRYLLPPWLRST